jgi:hypothetical protein
MKNIRYSKVYVRGWTVRRKKPNERRRQSCDTIGRGETARVDKLRDVVDGRGRMSDVIGDRWEGSRRASRLREEEREEERKKVV